MKRSFQLRQGGRYLAKYYNQMNLIFIEPNYCRSNDMAYTIDIEKLKEKNVQGLDVSSYLDRSLD